MNIENELKQMLRYEPDTGLLFWTDAANKSVRGKLAGTFNRGYVLVMYKSKFYKAHRIAWLLTHGSWPKEMIDHIDGNPSNNKLNNLRDVNNHINQCNRYKARVDSKSGLMGASPYRNKWRSQIKRNGVIKYLGVFNTAQEAHEAYKKEKNA